MCNMKYLSATRHLCKSKCSFVASHSAISHILWDDLTVSEEESHNLFKSTPPKDCMDPELAPTSMAKQGVVD